jgi:hypothetical protein
VKYHKCVITTSQNNQRSFRGSSQIVLPPKYQGDIPRIPLALRNNLGISSYRFAYKKEDDPMATTLIFTIKVSIRVHRDRPLNTRTDIFLDDFVSMTANKGYYF